MDCNPGLHIWNRLRVSTARDSTRPQRSNLEAKSLKEEPVSLQNSVITLTKEKIGCERLSDAVLSLMTGFTRTQITFFSPASSRHLPTSKLQSLEVIKKLKRKKILCSNTQILLKSKHEMESTPAGGQMTRYCLVCDLKHTSLRFSL